MLSAVGVCSFSHPVRFGHQQPQSVPRRLHQLFPTNRHTAGRGNADMTKEISVITFFKVVFVGSFE